MPRDAVYLWTSRFAYRSTSGDWWLLSSVGLHRFSGARDLASLNGRAPTAIYNGANGLKSDGAFQIFEDTQGSIWVSSRGGNPEGHGLSRMRKGEGGFRVLTQDEGYPDGKSVASFAEDESGNVWMGFYEGGMAVYDGSRFRLFDDKGGLPLNGHVTDIHIVG